MKLMKHITIALVLSAIPAMAFGQVTVTTACDAENVNCHVTPYFHGSGGFVAPAPADATELDYYVKCGNFAYAYEAAVSDGVASGLVECDEEGAVVQVQGALHGGWYWINDSVSSATAALMSEDVGGNAKTAPVDPGGLTKAGTETATFFRHESSGRVAILSHILPTPPIAACAGQADAASDCRLSSASQWGITATVPGATASAAPVSVAGGVVNRPTGDTATNVTVTVQPNGGHLLTAENVTSGGAATVTGGKVGTADRAAPDGVAAARDVNAAGAKVTYTVSVAKNDGRCAATNVDRGTREPVVVSVPAPSAGAVPLPTAALTVSFDVTCAPLASSSQQGEELVPENAFPAAR